MSRLGYDWAPGRDRLEHATLVTREMADRLARARMRFGIVTHSIFFFAEYDSYARNLSPEQFAIAYPIRTLYERCRCWQWPPTRRRLRGRTPTTSSPSLQAAVDRRAYDGSDLNRDEVITVGQALHLYTGKAAEISALRGLA